MRNLVVLLLLATALVLSAVVVAVRRAAVENWFRDIRRRPQWFHAHRGEWIAFGAVPAAIAGGGTITVLITHYAPSVTTPLWLLAPFLVPLIICLLLISAAVFHFWPFPEPRNIRMTVERLAEVYNPLVEAMYRFEDAVKLVAESKTVPTEIAEAASRLESTLDSAYEVVNQQCGSVAARTMNHYVIAPLPQGAPNAHAARWRKAVAYERWLAARITHYEEVYPDVMP